MTEEYYVSYYDSKDKYHYTIYYASRKEVEQVAKNLEEQGYKNIKVNTFRY